VADGYRKALHALHTQGYIHGDVRLPNFIMDKEGVVRIIDFERAKEGHEDEMAEEVEKLEYLLAGGDEFI
jgi:serine/threonine protein kinase